jgi:hypothetical protein
MHNRTRHPHLAQLKACPQHIYSPTASPLPLPLPSGGLGRGQERMQCQFRGRHETTWWGDAGLKYCWSWQPKITLWPIFSTGRFRHAHCHPTLHNRLSPSILIRQVLDQGLEEAHRPRQSIYYRGQGSVSPPPRRETSIYCQLVSCIAKKKKNTAPLGRGVPDWQPWPETPTGKSSSRQGWVDPFQPLSADEDLFAADSSKKRFFKYIISPPKPLC